MPHRLALLFVLLLFSGLLLTAGAAHGASSEAEPDPFALEEPLEKEGEEDEAELEEGVCEEAEEEFDEGELSAAEVKEICAEEAARDRPPAKPHRGKRKHHPHGHHGLPPPSGCRQATLRAPGAAAAQGQAPLAG